MLTRLLSCFHQYRTRTYLERYAQAERERRAMYARLGLIVIPD